MEKVKIDLHISNLLYQYDCVIVPDFGGFVSNYAPAKILPLQNKFLPPSKRISFNKNLQVNDGLLANHIAERKSIGYNQACELIKAFVKNTQDGLNKGNKIVIEKVGTLYADKEGNTCFSPEERINYLQESFGLEAFRKQAVKRDLDVDVQKKIKETIPIHAEGKNTIRKYWPAAAAVIFFAIGTVWLSMDEKPSNPYVNYSNFNLFPTKTSLYQPNEILKNAAPIKNSENYWIEKSQEFSELVLIKDLAKENPLIVRLDSKNSAVDNTFVADKNSSKRMVYHIVGGCFSVYSNAERLYEKLNSKGYSAKMLGKYNGLHAVSYKSFASRREAVEYLAYIKQSENKQAWLLVK